MFAFALLLSLQSDAFEMTADHLWVRDGLAMAIREEIVRVLPDDAPAFARKRRKGDRPDSRYLYAVVFHSAAQAQTQRLEALLEHPGSEAERASLIRAESLLPVYRRAAREFKTELASLGVHDLDVSNLERMSQRLEKGAPARDRPFVDVSADHWAAKAVGDLRALGLLDGYPDGRYRGASRRP